MSGPGTDSTAHKKCGLLEVIMFIIAIVSGTACSICSKTMMQLRGVGITGEDEIFEKPLFQTIGMFVGMMFGLVMHMAVLYFRIPFPGYEFPDTARPVPEVSSASSISYFNEEAPAPSGAMPPTEKDALLLRESSTNSSSQKDPGTFSNAAKPPLDSLKLPIWMYFFLIIPSVFDLAATVLCMMGLRYLNVSIYQMLRGSGIIFVAIMKQSVLGDRLYKFQWVGVLWNVVSVIMVGATAMLTGSTSAESSYSSPADDTLDDDNIVPVGGMGKSLLGVTLVLAGAFVQALQFVFEEKVMTMEVPSPPLLLIGMEGFWGTFLCLFVLYPIAYWLPGTDHGSYEDPFNTWFMFMNNRDIQVAFVIYFIVIFMYNLFAVMVTFMLNSVWHAILDNFRPMTVWGVDMFIFYIISEAFGEAWTDWSWLQLAGMVVLLYGTGIYNAPNAGSILLQRNWFSFGLDFSTEYQEIHDREEEERHHAEWMSKKAMFGERRNTGSFAGEWMGKDRGL